MNKLTPFGWATVGILFVMVLAMIVVGTLFAWYWAVIPGFVVLLGYVIYGYATCGKDKE